MKLRPEKNRHGRALHRVPGALWLLVVCCATCKGLEIFTGDHRADQIPALDAKVQEGSGSAAETHETGRHGSFLFLAGEDIIGSVSKTKQPDTGGRLLAAEDKTIPTEEGNGRLPVGYGDLFVPPFEPWATSDAESSAVSGPYDVFKNAADVNHVVDIGEDGQNIDREMAASMDKVQVTLPPEIALKTDECTFDFRAGLATSMDFLYDVFITQIGQRPKPDCPVVFLETNQYFVELVSSPAYGSSKVGSIPLSEWLTAGRTTETLFAGLFRPVDAVRHLFDDYHGRLPATHRSAHTISAHARAYFLQDESTRDKFVGCLGHLALVNNASTVLLATELNNFQAFVESKLGPSGIKVVEMSGVERSGEGMGMRNTVEQMQCALAEMMLVGEADFVVTTAFSTYSALAAARRGPSTQRIGGISCERLVNDPEFHSLECTRTMPQLPHVDDWTELYSDVVDRNRKRCRS
ncbi:unnamed protein product [Pylaiella littoralis]